MPISKERIKVQSGFFLAPGGCSGPRLALALDDAGDEDEKKRWQDIPSALTSDLLSQIKSAEIDLTSTWILQSRPEVPLPAGSGGGCGGCCGGCGSN